MDIYIAESDDKMTKTVEALSFQLSRLRTGKASPSLLDGITVDYYGAQTPLAQLGSVSAPEPRLLIVHPWDKSSINAIEKALRASELGINPSSDGTVIRIPIPALTEERRKEIVKLARKLAEEAKVALRNIRRDMIELVKAKQKEGEIPEDNSRKIQEKIQENTEKFAKKIDEALKSKETDIMNV